MLVGLLQLRYLLVHLGLVTALLLLEPLLDLLVEGDLLLRPVVDRALLILLPEARDPQLEVLDEVLDLVKLLLVHLVDVGLLAKEVLLRHGRHQEEVLPRAAAGSATDASGQGRGRRAHGCHGVEALVLNDRGWLQDDVPAALPANRLDLEVALQVLLVDLCQDRLLLLVTREGGLRASALVPLARGVPDAHACLLDPLDRRRVG